MAFVTADLRPIKDLGLVNYWHYLTADAPTVVDTAGYFNSAKDVMKVGDIVMVVQVDDVSNPATASAAGHHIVTQNDGTVVDVTNATAMVTTDSD